MVVKILQGFNIQTDRKIETATPNKYHCRRKIKKKREKQRTNMPLSLSCCFCIILIPRSNKLKRLIQRPSNLNFQNVVRSGHYCCSYSWRVGVYSTELRNIRRKPSISLLKKFALLNSATIIRRLLSLWRCTTWWKTFIMLHPQLKIKYRVT